MTAACPACSSAAVPERSASPKSGLQFSVPGIHCAACIGKIERGMNEVNGVSDARVNLSLKRLSIEGPVDPLAVRKKLTDLGFESFPLDQEVLKGAKDTVGRDLLLRLAVAGFAMMNVMLLSVAVWSGATGATRDLFHLISAGIALPVVAYSAQPFFRNAASALRVRRLNMDVPISLAIILAACMSLYESLNGGEHAYFDAALSLTFFLLIGRFLDHQTRSAARSAAKELTALEVHTAQIVRGGLVDVVPLTDVQVGDQILVPAGVRVPVDGVLLSSKGLMDRSFLTGESDAIAVSEGDVIHAGEINLGHPLDIRATTVGSDTSLRRMARLVETAENGRNSYTSLADRAAQIYAPAVHLLALVAFLAWLVATGDVRHSLNIAIAVLIITCPCALGLAVPAVTTAAISRLYSRGFLVKHATALERLAEVDYIVLDKTGTLTTPKASALDALSDEQKSVAFALAQRSSHPRAKALALGLTAVVPADVSDIVEIRGQGVEGRWRDQIVRLGRGDWIGGAFDGMGLRIGSADAIALEGSEALREGVMEALIEVDVPAEVLTGDAAGPAQKISEQLGLPVTAGVRPEGKLERLETLERDGHRTLMIGDGLNDTAALAAAHASLAPASALDASRSAADVVLMRDSFADIPLVLRVARMTGKLSRQNFAISTVYNLIAVPIALAGFATPLAAALAMSLSSITVIANAQRMRWVK